MTPPTIHLNGTSARQLKAEYEAAYRAVHAAVDAVAAVTVHGRDYYVQDGGAIAGPSFQKARDEHIARLQRLQEIQSELLDLYNAVAQQER